MTNPTSQSFSLEIEFNNEEQTAADCYVFFVCIHEASRKLDEIRRRDGENEFTEEARKTLDSLLNLTREKVGRDHP